MSHLQIPPAPKIVNYEIKNWEHQGRKEPPQPSRQEMMAAAGKRAGRHWGWGGAGCTAHAGAWWERRDKSGRAFPGTLSESSIAWILWLCLKPSQSFIACPGTLRRVRGLIWITAKTKMADQWLLQIFKLGPIQLLSGPFPLAALAGTPLPENKARRPASWQRRSGLNRPLQLRLRFHGATRNGQRPPAAPPPSQPRPASASLLAAPRPSCGRYVTAPRSPTPEPF